MGTPDRAPRLLARRPGRLLAPAGLAGPPAALRAPERGVGRPHAGVGGAAGADRLRTGPLVRPAARRAGVRARVRPPGPPLRRPQRRAARAAEQAARDLRSRGPARTGPCPQPRHRPQLPDHRQCARQPARPRADRGLGRALGAAPRPGRHRLPRSGLSNS
ncbi:hypothetical protein B9W68_27890 [Streptomyces sp. CS227]|nr:hypothetical protein B9W68_27890 [Streptomyces sp. CS227]